MTPLETRLWRALNGEPEDQSDDWPSWSVRQIQFRFLHPADRLAYFEGKVREAGCRLGCVEEADKRWTAIWGRGEEIVILVTAPDEHTARLTAAARALVALGVVEEIDDE